MPITVLIPTLMQSRADGRDRVTVEASTVSGVLKELLRKHPALRSHLVADDGQVHRFVNLYLGAEDIRHLDGLATFVRDGDVLSIVPAVAGG